MPEYGTALLCASGPRDPARAPPDLPYTMFTGGLLEVLRDGDADAPPCLSLDNVHRLVQARLAARFKDKAVLPQVHAPHQRRGRVDLVPLFRNPARRREVDDGAAMSSAKDVVPHPAVSAELRVPAVEKAVHLGLGNALRETAEEAVARGVALLKTKQYLEAAQAFMIAANQGNAWGQSNLGELYENGQGVQQSYAEAARLYRLAADQGNASGQNSLGLLYQYGEGVQQSFAEAARLFKLAADQGNAWSQHNLGVLYRDGRGMPQSFAEAARLFKLAADQGNAWGQNNLGALYRDGQGVPQSFAEAARLYRLAADQGNAWGQYNLGVLYERGAGVSKSPATAVEWYRKAARQNLAIAQDALRRLGQNW